MCFRSFSVLPIICVVWLNGDIDLAYEYPKWHDVRFVCWFFGTNLMGLMNLYSWILCTDYNSPLMAQIVACLRSILVTYIGMFVGGDYVFTWTNFIGLNISMFGGFAYSYATFKGSDKTVSDSDKSAKEKLVNGQETV